MDRMGPFCGSRPRPQTPLARNGSPVLTLREMAAEAVYNDERNPRVYDGKTGKVLVAVQIRLEPRGKIQSSSMWMQMITQRS